MDREKMINRIRNCLALATNNDSEGESINAMKMARKLMALHQVSMSEVEQADPNNMGKIVLHVGNRLWKRWLASSLSQFLGVFGVYSKHQKSVIVFGDKAILEPFQWCWNLATKEIDRAVAPISKSKDNYRKSMVLGIQSQLVTVQQTDEQTTSIVLQAGVKARDYALSQISVSEKHPKVTRIHRNNQAYEQGQEIGSRLRNQDKVLGEE